MVKLRKRICGLFSALFCLGGLLLALSGPAGAASYVINSSLAGPVDPNFNTLSDLRTAYPTLADGDSITFMNDDATLGTEFALVAGATLTLAKGAGNGLISAAGATRFLSVLSNATINWGTGLTFSGFSNHSRGGVVHAGGELMGGIANSTFTGNEATNDSGGAVFVFDRLTGGISGSTFENNTATGFGNAGGAVFVGGALTGGIANSTFTSNTASYGGAVLVGSGLTGGITDSIFTSNTADFGGAVSVNGGLTGGISGSTFENNTAGSGGAVSVNGGLTGGISGSTFENNTAALSGGGAVFVGSGLTGGISGSTFTSNTASYGGAVTVWGDLTGDISGSEFSGNQASWGGALYLVGNVDISGAGAQFLGNKAVYDAANTSFGRGGAIFHNGGQNPGDPVKTFNLSATPGTPIVFSGNTHTPGNAGATPNSIYFGNLWPAGVDGQVAATFAVAAGGALHMWDPLASQPDDLGYVAGGASGTLSNLALTINKTGPGTWVLAGTSDMRSATNWTVSEGTLHLVADAAGAPAHIKLSNTTNKMNVANPASFTLKNGASLLLEPASAAHQITGRKITLESGSKVGLAGFQYGPKLANGLYTVLKLNAPNFSNESSLMATSGDIALGVNSYKYSGLAWDGHNLVMTVGPGTQNPFLAGVPAVTGASHMVWNTANTALTALGNHNFGIFRALRDNLQGNYSGGNMLAPDTEETKQVSRNDGAGIETNSAAPAAGEATARYRHADQPNSFWFTPYYAHTNQSGDDFGYDLDTPALALGFERLLGERAFAGLAVFAAWPEYGGGGANIDGQNLTLALYGGGILPWGDLEVDGHVGYGWTDYDQTRRVGLPDLGLMERYTAEYDSQTFFAGLGLGRTFDLNSGFWLRPGASYDYIHASVDGFNEGAGDFSLSVDDYDLDLHRVKAGLEAGWESEAGFTASAEAYYLGLYGDREAETDGHFVADPANGFDIIGNGLDENSLGLGAKIGLPLGPNWELGVGYDFLVGSDATTHQGSATVTFRF